MRQSPRCHREPHVLRSVNEFKYRGRRLVLFEGLDAQNPSVAPWPGEVALPEGGEEFWDELDGILYPKKHPVRR